MNVTESSIRNRKITIENNSGESKSYKDKLNKGVIQEINEVS